MELPPSYLKCLAFNENGFACLWDAVGERVSSISQTTPVKPASSRASKRSNATQFSIRMKLHSYVNTLLM